VLADVSAKLLDQFVADLEKTVLHDDAPGEAGSDAAAEAVETELEDPIEATQPDAGEPAVPASADPEPVRGEVAMAVAPPEDALDKPAVRKIDSPEPTPVDLLETAGSPVARRVGPVLVAIAVLWVLKKLLTRNRG